jgi:hypothetical protein
MIFGAVTAVCNYDIVGSVPYMLAQIESGIPNNLVCRAVDDVPAISPANSNWGERFSSTYKRICRELNIQLAEECREFNKSFWIYLWQDSRQVVRHKYHVFEARRRQEVSDTACSSRGILCQGCHHQGAAVIEREYQ